MCVCEREREREGERERERTRERKRERERERERAGECVSVRVCERENVCFERFDSDWHCSGTFCVCERERMR